MPQWVLDLVQWLLSPALVLGGLWLLAQFFEPTIRWGRRLNRDLLIANGLSAGAEKERWDKANERLAEKLRDYRRAMTLSRLAIKWGSVAYIAFAVGLLIIWPPVNTPQTLIPFVPGDYYLLIWAALLMAVHLAWTSLGRSASGRSISQMLAADRVKRYKHRLRRIDRLDKQRAYLISEGVDLKPKSSQLGFSTQADELSRWVTTWQQRDVASSTGSHRVGGDHEAQKSLARQAGYLSPTSVVRMRPKAPRRRWFTRPTQTRSTDQSVTANLRNSD